MNKAAIGFDYEAALGACARGERSALKLLYDQEARWLMGVALCEWLLRTAGICRGVPIARF